MVRGQVERVTEAGVKIGGKWFNYSKFDEVEPPAAGSLVELRLNRGRWIKSVSSATPSLTEASLVRAAEATTEETPKPNPSDVPPLPDVGDPFAGLEPPADEQDPRSRAVSLESPVYTVHSGDPLLRRLSVLRTAAEFHAGRAKSSDTDVLATADLFLTWLEQPPPKADEGVAQ